MSSARRFALASDLDGTFTAGTRAERTALHDLITARTDATLIYITGRSADSARALIGREDLPIPTMLVSDVGTSVFRGLEAPVESIERYIAARWPGAEAVDSRLSTVEGLTPQDIRAPNRASYWIVANRNVRDRGVTDDPFEARGPDDPSMSEAAAHIAVDVAMRARRALADLSVDVLVSGNVYLDVLPRDVNKGTTLLRVLAELRVPVEECIVAGDSLNDRALFEIGASGILVGNCEPALRAAVGDYSGVYVARAAGAAGILEGLRHLAVSERADQKGSDHGE